jgi:hypothetical protein
MPAPQNYKNHTRFDPMFHFVILPLLLLNLIFSIYVTIHHWPEHPHLNPWWIVMSVVFIMMAGHTRELALKVQNRVIRLEERLRLASLVTASELVELESLTTRQLIGLRFASNPELPELARRAVRENLTSKQIKASIVSWRDDNERV